MPKKQQKQKVHKTSKKWGNPPKKNGGVVKNAPWYG